MAGANWSWSEIEAMWSRPDWTSAELGELLGRSAQSVRHQRYRYGRWPSNARMLCCRCEQRPVWAESPRAKAWRLCKGCYLDEERMRLEDKAKADAIRQRRRKGRG